MICPAEKLTLPGGGFCVIRSAAPEDAPAMLRYMKQMLGETPYLLRTPEEFNYTPEEEADILSLLCHDPRSLMLLAETDGEIIASADVMPLGTKSRILHRCDLGISVRRDYWHQGIGSALMERLIAFAGEAGYEQLELEAVAENRRALGLYMKYGFTVYGTRPHGMKYPDGTYADDYLMVRRLDRDVPPLPGVR